jgi:hypothetical protein
MRKIYILSVLIFFIVAILPFSNAGKSGDNLDSRLYAVLHNQGFTGEIQKQPKIKPARKLDKRTVDVGRLIFFDKVLGYIRIIPVPDVRLRHFL